MMELFWFLAIVVTAPIWFSIIIFMIGISCLFVLMVIGLIAEHLESKPRKR